MATLPRVRLHTGASEDWVSTPTCGLCNRQIERDEVYASVLTAPARREVRHNTEDCLKYEYGPASALVVGTMVHTHRYTIAEWCGRVPGVITERTERFDGRGWRAYVIKPEGEVDTDAIREELRGHREEFFRREADTMTFNLEPQEVFISDGEWTHYIPKEGNA